MTVSNRVGRDAASSRTSLREIARLFLKLGTIGFGGPAAHIAMMEDEVVRRRGWLTRDEYLDYLGATNLIPGPNSTELAIHIGRARGGWPGLLVAGTCFILPSALLTTGFGWAYVRYGSLPAAEGVLYGVKPVVIAVVLQVVLGFAAVAALFLGVHELAVLAVLAFLRADLVERLGWLTERQLLDAVAVGQVTPGPVFTTATFIGYVLRGGAGAVVATVGIFLPAFIFVALSGLVLPALRRSPATGAVLDGVNVASLAMMAVVSWQLGYSALVDPVAIALATVSAVLLFRYRVNSAWLVLAGAVVGMVVRR